MMMMMMTSHDVIETLHHMIHKFLLLDTEEFSNID